MIREIQTGGSGPGRTGGGVQLPMPMLQDVENGGKMVIPAGEDVGRYREIVAKHYGRLFGRNVLCMKAVNRLVFLVGGSRDASREVEDDGQWMDRCFTLSGLQRQLRKKGEQGFSRQQQQIKCLCGQVVGWWMPVNIGRVNEDDGGRL